MIKEQARLIAVVTVLLDLLVLILSFQTAYLVRDQVMTALLPGFFPHGLFELEAYLWMYAVILPAWVGLFLALRLYSSARLMTFRHLLVDLAKANAVGLGLVVAVAYLLKLQDLSRSFLILFGVVNLLFISAGRLLLRAVRLWLCRLRVILASLGPMIGYRSGL